MNLNSVLESLMFAWGEPLNINEISKILNVPAANISVVLNDMVIKYEEDENRGLVIKKYGNSYQLITRKENYEYIQNLLQSTQNKSLSTAAMETLSIIAYKQPVTKVEIELIRGVKCSQVVKGLLEKGLVKETGRLDKPGRPAVYATTDEFLRHFDLKSICELPDSNMENGHGLYTDGDKKAKLLNEFSDLYRSDEEEKKAT